MEDKKRLVDFFARKRKTTRQKKPSRLQKLFSFFGSDTEQKSPVTLLSKTEFKNKQITLGSSKNVKFLPALQTGGIVTEPTEVLAGEAGPEAIIPLDKLQKIISEMSPDDVPVGTTDSVVLANRARINAGPSETMATVLQEIPLGTSKMSKATINGIVMDRNQDGEITREEAAEARSLKGSSDPLTERVVKAENIERTQKMAEARGVSVEDLTTGKSDYGNEVPLDLNKDGIVTPEERQEANRRRDEMDLGTIRDRGDEVRESRRNLETEKSLYGGMTREQAVLRFGEGAVRDREDIVMDNATGPQGTEDIRQIERVTERNRAGDRDRKYVDDSRQQRYEDSSNRLRDQKQELRDMTLEMNRVSKGAGEFTQVTPSDIADARGRFNQGQREIENQKIEDGSLLSPAPDRSNTNKPKKDVPIDIDAENRMLMDDLLDFGYVPPDGPVQPPEQASEEIVPRGGSTEVSPLKKLQEAKQEAEEERKRKGLPDPNASTEVSPLKKLQEANAGRVPPKEPDLNIPLGNPLEILQRKRERDKSLRQRENAVRKRRGLPPRPGPDDSTEVDPLDKLPEPTLAPAPKLITKRDPSSLPSGRGKPPTVPAIQSEEDYRRELQEERERNSKKESEKTEEDFYRDPITGESTKDFDRAPTLAELGIPEDDDGKDGKDGKDGDQVTPPPSPAPQQPAMDPQAYNNPMNRPTLAMATPTNPPMVPPSAFAPASTISGAMDFTTDFGVLSLLNQTTPQWRTT